MWFFSAHGTLAGHSFLTCDFSACMVLSLDTVFLHVVPWVIFYYVYYKDIHNGFITLKTRLIMWQMWPIFKQMLPDTICYCAQDRLTCSERRDYFTKSQVWILYLYWKCIHNHWRKPQDCKLSMTSQTYQRGKWCCMPVPDTCFYYFIAGRVKLNKCMVFRKSFQACHPLKPVTSLVSFQELANL